MRIPYCMIIVMIRSSAVIAAKPELTSWHEKLLSPRLLSVHSNPIPSSSLHEAHNFSYTPILLEKNVNGKMMSKKCEWKNDEQEEK